jgi:YesN/AraC family two-component response regulator
MIVDDHAVVRTGYRRLIDAEADLCVVTDVATGDEACAALRVHAIDVVVMDLSLREGSGLEAINTRARYLDILNDLKEESFDYYLSSQSYFMQHRQGEVGQSDLTSDEDWFDDELEEDL